MAVKEQRTTTTTPAGREMRRLAWLMDNVIRLPGGYRIGLDGIVGLIPGVGDALGLVASSYILFRARRFDIPRVVMARMIGNIALESVIGAIPFLGDLFDFVFKANSRNIALMEQYFVNERQVRRGSWAMLIVAAVTVLLLIVLILFIASRLIQWFAELASA